MMPAFTSCTNAANAPNRGSDPTPPDLNHMQDVTIPCDDHTERPRTPLRSPTRHSSPTGLRLDVTPLHRRFLDEVGMSPVTPPRTPSPTKPRASPSKRSESPSKGKGSPTKQRLEIGPGGFYFECELPPSKITPKKKDQEVRTPTRRTPSPTKMGGGTHPTMSRDPSPAKNTPSRRASPEKQTPSRSPHKSAIKQKTPAPSGVGALAGTKSSATKNDIPSKSATPNSLSSTPLRKLATPQSEESGQSGRPSPTKSIKLASKIAKDAVTPKPLRFGTEQPGLKQHAASKEISSSAFSSSKTSPRPTPSAVGKVQTRPARVGSFNIGESMASLNKHTPQQRNVESGRHGVGSDISGPPTPLRKEAEKLAHIGYVRLLDSKHDSAVKEHKVQAQSVNLADAVSEPHVYASPFRIKEQTSHYQPLPPALEAPSSSELKPTSTPLKKQVKFLGSEPTPTASRLPRPKTMRRAGTDPLLHLAMRQEMSTLSKSLSDSLGVDFRSMDSQNTSPLPSLMDTVLGSAQGTPHPKRRNQLLRTASDVTDVSNASGSSVRTAGSNTWKTQRQPAAPATPNTAKDRGMPSSKGTPVSVRKDTRAAAKSPDEQHHLRKVVSYTSGLARPRSAASTSTATSQKKPTTRVLEGTPSFARPTKSTTGSKTAATPAKPRPTSTVPQSARKPALVSPARPKASRPSCQPSTQPEPAARPVFVGAQHIAARIAEWNRPKTQRSPAKPFRTIPSPPKFTPKVKEKESYTPPGSPPKLANPTALGQGQKTPTSTPRPPKTLTSLSPNTPTTVHPKTPHHTNRLTPMRAPPGTPVQGPRIRPTGQNRTPVGTRTLGQNRTPGQARAITRLRADPIATRTPSKSIQDSLSEAIDRKIEEDRRGGMCLEDVNE